MALCTTGRSWPPLLESREGTFLLGAALGRVRASSFRYGHSHRAHRAGLAWLAVPSLIPLQPLNSDRLTETTERGIRTLERYGSENRLFSDVGNARPPQ